MNQCRHHYIYAYESKVHAIDIKYLNKGLTETTVSEVCMGMRAAFYICGKCNHYLIAGRLAK